MNVLVHAAPFRNADGEIDRVIEMSTDITQVRQLQDKLTSVGLLISSISHGIKGLLNSLDGGIYLVDTGLKNNDRERIDRGWEMAARNVRRIRSMVQDILFYAKDREPEYEIISAPQFVEDFCNQVKERAKRLKITFDYDIDPDAGDFEIDPQAVRSLMLNLFENSIDACRVDSKKPEHSLGIALKGAQESVTITVSDNGIGMDQETREKAFSMFFSSKGAGGTGLGLFIANKIAQSHGGSIKIESQENEGCCFTVELPRKRPDIVIEPDAPINYISQ
jgi:signal transduction histidine kinase